MREVINNFFKYGGEGRRSRGRGIGQQSAKDTTHHCCIFRLLEVLREVVKLSHSSLDFIKIPRHLLLLVGVDLCLVVSQLLLKILPSAKRFISICLHMVCLAMACNKWFIFTNQCYNPTQCLVQAHHACNIYMYMYMCMFNLSNATCKLPSHSVDSG